MGFFSSLKSAAIEANEETHGVRLARELEDAMAGIARMHDSVRTATLLAFLHTREELRVKMRNWSRDGSLDVARGLQNDARKEFDLNIAKSYALWMSGAWLEGIVRNSTRARAVHEHLEGLALGLLSDPDVSDRITQRT